MRGMGSEALRRADEVVLAGAHKSTTVIVFVATGGSSLDTAKSIKPLIVAPTKTSKSQVIHTHLKPVQFKRSIHPHTHRMTRIICPAPIQQVVGSCKRQMQIVRCIAAITQNENVMHTNMNLGIIVCSDSLSDIATFCENFQILIRAFDFHAKAVFVYLLPHISHILPDAVHHFRRNFFIFHHVLRCATYRFGAQLRIRTNNGIQDPCDYLCDACH